MELKTIKEFAHKNNLGDGLIFENGLFKVDLNKEFNTIASSLNELHTDKVDKDYVDLKIDGLTGLYKIMGSSETSILNNITPEVGHVYNLKDSGILFSGIGGDLYVEFGSNVVWTSEGWDKLSGSVLSAGQNISIDNNVISAKGYTSTDWDSFATGNFRGWGNSIASGESSFAEGCSISAGMCSHSEGLKDQLSIAIKLEKYNDYEYYTDYSLIKKRIPVSVYETSGKYLGTINNILEENIIIDDVEYCTFNITSDNNLLNIASGDYILGFITGAYGDHSHSEGNGTIASGLNSHAEGYHTEAEGENSHAEGDDTNAFGHASHAEGGYTITNNSHEHAQGKYNKSNTGETEDIKTLHSIGIGTSEETRKNAQEVMQNGDHYIIGIGGYDGTNISDEGVKTLQEVLEDISDGSNYTAGDNISIEGKTISAKGYVYDSEKKSFATGSTYTTASGWVSHAEGSNTKAIGNYSHAEGGSTEAKGAWSHAEGGSTVANNDNEHAQGCYNVSNKYSDDFGDERNTIHSIGIGTSPTAKKNAQEVMQNGDFYVINVGGYNGTNIKEEGVKTLQLVIDSKVEKEGNKGLSTEDYTTEDKDKLSKIEAGAQVNTVTSVNNKQGDVIINISDINDLQNQLDTFVTNSEVNSKINNVVINLVNGGTAKINSEGVKIFDTLGKERITLVDKLVDISDSSLLSINSKNYTSFDEHTLDSLPVAGQRNFILHASNNPLLLNISSEYNKINIDFSGSLSFTRAYSLTFTDSEYYNVELCLFDSVQNPIESLYNISYKVTSRTETAAYYSIIPNLEVNNSNYSNLAWPDNVTSSNTVITMNVNVTNKPVGTYYLGFRVTGYNVLNHGKIIMSLYKNDTDQHFTSTVYDFYPKTLVGLNGAINFYSDTGYFGAYFDSSNQYNIIGKADVYNITKNS